MNRRRLLSAFIAASAVFTFSVIPAWAGMKDQPRLADADAARFRAASALFAPNGGDPGKGRGDLLLLVEATPAADFTGYIVTAMADDAAYSGVTATLADTIGALPKNNPQLPYLYYNLARAHYLRSTYYRSQTAMRPVLDIAVRTLDKIPATLPDAALYELRGDIETARGNTDAAVGAFKRMITTGGSSAAASYKTGLVYLRANRIADAQSALQSAIRAAGSGAANQRTAHYANLALAQSYLQQGNTAAALTVFAQSAKVKQDTVNPFNFQLDLASALLQRGFVAEVRAFAQAAVLHSPSDQAAKDLLQAAKSPRR